MRASRTNRGERYRTLMMNLPGFVIYRGVHPNGTELPKHAHDDPTLCYVMRGRFTEYSSGLAVDCVSDTLKITPGGEMHWNRFAAGETHGLRIDVDRSRFADSPAIDRLLGERLSSTGSHAANIIHRLLREMEAADDASVVAAEGLLLELLASLARDAAPSRSSVIPPWVREADEIVHESYAARIGLGDVARVVGVAPARLARGYRAGFGISIGERIRQLRMDRATRDLLTSREPLSLIALRAGFYDQSHFTNAFRARFGLTPAQYRLAAGKIQ